MLVSKALQGPPLQPPGLLLCVSHGGFARLGACPLDTHPKVSAPGTSHEAPGHSSHLTLRAGAT